MEDTPNSGGMLFALAERAKIQAEAIEEMLTLDPAQGAESLAQYAKEQGLPKEDVVALLQDQGVTPEFMGKFEFHLGNN